MDVLDLLIYVVQYPLAASSRLLWATGCDYLLINPSFPDSDFLIIWRTS
jgi:hypothetical protein